MIHHQLDTYRQEMIRLNKEYGVKIPYQTQLKK